MKNNSKKIISNFLRFFSLTIKTVSILVVTFFVVLYLIVQPSKENISNDEAEQTREITQEEFILQITPYAQKVSTSHGVRPSLLIAQAALESNWGNSRLAKESNNYFGVKNPVGKEYVTKEFTQSEWIEIKASFRQYDSVYDSVLDYARLLKNGTSWDEDLYAKVIEATSYEEAAYALINAGYATDPDYAEKLIQIIENYELNTLDSR